MENLAFDLFPLLATVTVAQVELWIGVICTVLITLTTCGVNVYRMIRDRDIDKTAKKEEQEKEQENGKN